MEDKKNLLKKGYGPKKSLETRTGENATGLVRLEEGYNPKPSLNTRASDVTKHKTKTKPEE